MKTKELFFSTPPKHHNKGVLCSNYVPYIHSYTAKSDD